NEAGLLADPTRYLRDPAKWPAPLSLDEMALTKLLLERSILVGDRAAYRERFAIKDSLLDRTHFGNFHQQLGQQLLINRRTNPDEWWLNQKFTADRNALCNNPYQAVQEYFLDRQIPRWFKAGQRVIDAGCGIGYFTEKIARTGAE